MKGRREHSSRRNDRESSDIDSKVLDLARVTRVVAGGKRMRFRACVIVGDRKGRVGVGIRKGLDVSDAIGKATRAGEKSMISVSMINETIPHEVSSKFGAAKIILKPASKGTGIIAGGSIRVVLELAGVANVMSKMLGSNNKMNNAQATLKALQSLRSREHLKAIRKQSAAS